MRVRDFEVEVVHQTGRAGGEPAAGVGPGQGDDERFSRGHVEGELGHPAGVKGAGRVLAAGLVGHEQGAALAGEVERPGARGVPEIKGLVELDPAETLPGGGPHAVLGPVVAPVAGGEAPHPLSGVDQHGLDQGGRRIVAAAGVTPTGGVPDPSGRAEPVPEVLPYEDRQPGEDRGRHRRALEVVVLVGRPALGRHQHLAGRAQVGLDPAVGGGAVAGEGGRRVRGGEGLAAVFRGAGGEGVLGQRLAAGQGGGARAVVAAGEHGDEVGMVDDEIVDPGGVGLGVDPRALAVGVVVHPGVLGRVVGPVPVQVVDLPEQVVGVVGQVELTAGLDVLEGEPGRGGDAVGLPAAGAVGAGGVGVVGGDAAGHVGAVPGLVRRAGEGVAPDTQVGRHLAVVSTGGRHRLEVGRGAARMGLGVVGRQAGPAGGAVGEGPLGGMVVDRRVVDSGIGHRRHLAGAVEAAGGGGAEHAADAGVRHPQGVGVGQLIAGPEAHPFDAFEAGDAGERPGSVGGDDHQPGAGRPGSGDSGHLGQFAGEPGRGRVALGPHLDLAAVKAREGRGQLVGGLVGADPADGREGSQGRGDPCARRHQVGGLGQVGEHDRSGGRQGLPGRARGGGVDLDEPVPGVGRPQPGGDVGDPHERVEGAGGQADGGGIRLPAAGSGGRRRCRPPGRGGRHRGGRAQRRASPENSVLTSTGPYSKGGT